MSDLAPPSDSVKKDTVADCHNRIFTRIFLFLNKQKPEIKKKQKSKILMDAKITKSTHSGIFVYILLSTQRAEKVAQTPATKRSITGNVPNNQNLIISNEKKKYQQKCGVSADVAIKSDY